MFSVVDAVLLRPLPYPDPERVGRSAARGRELGVRAALGALYRDLLAPILKQAVLLSTAGIAAGLMLGAFATRTLESMLFETRRADPLTIAAIIALVPGLTLVASWQPARGAARVDQGPPCHSHFRRHCAPAKHSVAPESHARRMLVVSPPAFGSTFWVTPIVVWSAT